MQTFELNLTSAQLVIPPICTGMLAVGLLLYTYMYSRYRINVYLAVAVSAMLATIFVGSETVILIGGSWFKDQATGRQFHRIEQLAGAYFLFALPYLLTSILTLNKKWQKINRIISFAGLICASIIAITAFIFPDTFISQQIPVYTWNRFEGDFARGQEGIVYSLRDTILGIMMLYSIFCFIFDIIKNRNISKLIFPVAGILAAIYGAIIDIIFVHTSVMHGLFPTQYFSRFSLGITAMIMLFITEITRQFIDTAREVESAHKIISISEKKYRLLVEQTDDCIFSLNMDYNFINANNSSLKQLHLHGKTLNSTNFFDIIYSDPDDMKFSRQIIKGKLEQLISEKKPVSFKVTLKAFGTKEPKEYSVRCELIHVDDENEILVKASNIHEDGPMKYIDSETARFTIGNYLIAADEISKRLVLNLPKFMDKAEVNSLRIGLREIIINAIEHGNLNISFEEKSEASMNDDYLEFILSRQKDPRYRDKKVSIEFSLTPEKAAYKITDDGNGFDYSEILTKFREKANSEMLAHGRGIAMAMNVFDDIQFNKKGNQILLTKEFRKTS